MKTQAFSTANIEDGLQVTVMPETNPKPGVWASISRAFGASSAAAQSPAMNTLERVMNVPVNRRALVAGATAIPISSVSMPTSAGASEPSVGRVGGSAVELARELAKALDTELEGQWVAKVMPASRTQFPVEFVASDLPRQRPLIQKLIMAHQEAVRKLSGEVDRIIGKRHLTPTEERRVDKASDAVREALLAVCRCPAVTSWEADTKASYLLMNSQQEMFEGAPEFGRALLESMLTDPEERRIDIARAA